jgi:hypothetical protein
MPQRDVVLRWIEQVSRVVARLLHGPGPIDLELAADQVEAALAHHLGPLHALLPQLEFASAAALLHDPDRLFGYAQLLALLAAVQQAQDDSRAPVTRARALAMAREAIGRDPDAPEEWRAWLAEAERAPATQQSDPAAGDRPAT